MKFYLISDNIDTQMGMRLAGIEGTVAHTAPEVEAALESAFADETIAAVLMTEKLIKLCSDRVYELKLTRSRPLIVEIPDRHGNSSVSEAISRYVGDAVGIKL